MSSDDLIKAVATLNPRALSGARKLVVAMQLITSGTVAGDARRMMRDRFGCSRTEAWRIVSMALDLAEPVQKEEA